MAPSTNVTIWRHAALAAYALVVSGQHPHQLLIKCRPVPHDSHETTPVETRCQTINGHAATTSRNRSPGPEVDPTNSSDGYIDVRILDLQTGGGPFVPAPAGQVTVAGHRSPAVRPTGSS